MDIVCQYLLDGIPPKMAPLESAMFIVIAFSLAFLASYYLGNAGKRIKNEMKMKGELGTLKWIYTGTGRAAVFLTVFLVIIVAYVTLRMTPAP